MTDSVQPKQMLSKAQEASTLSVIWRGRRVWAFLRIATLALLGSWLVAWVAAQGLITEAAMDRADAIVVLSNPSAYVERTGHAAQLWKAGRAPRVLITNENLLSSWSEAEQRNPLFSERAAQELRLAGVPPEKIEVLPTTVRNTFDEAVLLREYASENKLKSLLVVTSAYHSRRSLWIFRNVFRDTGIAIGLDAVSPGQQTPGAGLWWLQPRGWKIVALEYPKLLYYWFRYRSLSTDPSLSLQRATGPDVKTSVGTTQAGMTLSLSAPVSSYTDEVVLIDARKSTGVPKKPQSDGTPSVTINFGDGYTCNLLACGHAYRKAGTYTITVTAKNDSGGPGAPATTSIQVTDIPTAAELNSNNGAGQNLIDMSNPSGNRAYYIPENAYRNATANAAKLHAAIKRAAASNVELEQEIVLPAGAVFAGPILLPTPAGSKYITIRSARLNELPAGNRVGPSQGNLMPVITAPSSATHASAALETPAPAPANPPHHYRIQGIHLKKDDETKRSAMLMNIGTDVSGGKQDKISKLPHHFIVDRSWFDGGASDRSEVTNGLRIYANAVSVVDSYFAEFRLIGAGVDTAAISVTIGQGPFSFINNTMVATSENFSIAGASAEKNTGVVTNPTISRCTLSRVTNLEIDQNIAFKVDGSYGPAQSTVVRSISGNTITFDPIPKPPDDGSSAEWITTPSYIEFRANYIFKPLKWWPKHPSWNGIKYQIKNFWEAKFGRYIVVDGNVMENLWLADQGYAIAISVRHGNGGFSPAAVIREMQWSNNIIRNAAAGINILAHDYAGPTQLTTDISFRNNLFQNVGLNFDSSGAGHMLINMQNGRARQKRIFLIHNTYDNGMPKNSNGMITDFGDNGGADESLWVNNLFQHSGYGFRSNSSVVDSDANIRRFLPPGGPSVWNKNMVVNIGSANYPGRPQGIYPSGSWPALFVDYAAGDFTLASGSPGRNAAADGTDIGVNMAQLRAATLHSVDGQWSTTDHRSPAAPQAGPGVRPRLVKPR